MKCLINGQMTDAKQIQKNRYQGRRQQSGRKWLLLVLFLFTLAFFQTGDSFTHEVKAAVQSDYTGWKTTKGKQYYYKNGKKVKGLQTISGTKYYFSKLTGVLQKKTFKTVKGKRYYFNKNGKAVKGLVTIKKNLYYFSSKGVMQKGWKTIDGNKYYFQSSGKAVKNKNKKIGKIYASFDASGVYQITASYVLVSGNKMQVQYNSDPEVSEETLLAAIIYAEAGGERQSKLTASLGGQTLSVYKGQLAVGYTIAKRMESRSYPSSLKGVIYSRYQFEPARTGVLTNLLKNQSLISEECRNAAKVVLNDMETGEDSVAKYKRSKFDWYNFWALSYARNQSNFFSVYAPDEYEIIGNQVFFNYTKSIATY